MSKMIKEETWKLAAKSFTEGELSFDELVDFLGYEDATKIAYYKNIERYPSSRVWHKTWL